MDGQMLREDKLLADFKKRGWKIHLAWLPDRSFGECHFKNKTITVNIAACIVSTVIHELAHWELRNVSVETLPAKAEEKKVCKFEEKRYWKLKGPSIQRLAKKIIKEAINETER